MTKDARLEKFEPMIKKEETRPQGLLMHYTTEAGLYGILKSQTLWATHFEFLNDKEEFWNFFIRHESDVVFRGLFNASEKVFPTEENQEIRQSLDDLKELVQNVLKDHGLFIVSFCKVSDWQIERDGDLTMWCSYAADGGYAIVFNKEELQEIMKDESIRNNYLLGPLIKDCRYSLTKEERESFYKKLIDKGKKKTSPIAFLQAIIDGCTVKHDAFKAENESRIFSYVHFEGQDTRTKEIKFRTKDNVPYIDLNKSVGAIKCMLPIKAIVVGPHKYQDERVRGLEIWLQSHGYGSNIKVRRSTIPFAGFKNK